MKPKLVKKGSNYCFFFYFDEKWTIKVKSEKTCIIFLFCFSTDAAHYILQVPSLSAKFLQFFLQLNRLVILNLFVIIEGLPSISQLKIDEKCPF